MQLIYFYSTRLRAVLHTVWTPRLFVLCLFCFTCYFVYIFFLSIYRQAFLQGRKEVVEGGGAVCMGWMGVVSAELQRRIIVGCHRVSCDSGEAKTAAFYPHLPSSPSPPPPNKTSKGVCGMASAELGGWLRLLHSGPSRFNTVWTSPSEAGKPPTLCFYFCLVIFWLFCCLTHTSTPLFPSPLFHRDHGSTDCVIATSWQCWLRDRDTGETCHSKCCPEAFSDLH